MLCSTPTTARSGSSEGRTNLTLTLTLAPSPRPTLAAAFPPTHTRTLTLTRFVREEDEGVSLAEDAERARILASE